MIHATAEDRAERQSGVAAMVKSGRGSGQSAGAETWRTKVGGGSHSDLAGGGSGGLALPSLQMEESTLRRPKAQA